MLSGQTLALPFDVSRVACLPSYNSGTAFARAPHSALAVGVIACPGDRPWNNYRGVHYRRREHARAGGKEDTLHLHTHLQQPAPITCCHIAGWGLGAGVLPFFLDTTRTLHTLRIPTHHGRATPHTQPALPTGTLPPRAADRLKAGALRPSWCRLRGAGGDYCTHLNTRQLYLYQDSNLYKLNFSIRMKLISMKVMT